jgi:O-acetyl-ADP-ribose deacetylase (regulator of RNase III)
MVQILFGDIFNSKAQTLVNPVNCAGIMGKGLALAFKNKYSDMFMDYEQKCKHGFVRLGKPYFYKSLFPPYILLFPTKDHWRSVSNIHAIEDGLQYLKKNYNDWGITSIAVPSLGCGLGELDWRIVCPILYKHLKDLDIKVELYAPFGTLHRELIQKFLDEQSK